MEPTTRDDGPVKQLAEHNARKWNVTGAEYHSTPGVYGKSMIEEYGDCPQLFYGRHVAGDLPKKAQTAAMKFGSDYDRFLLESEAVIEIPPDVLSKSLSKAGTAWKEFEAAHAGKLLLKTAEYDVFRRMRDIMMAHPDASKLIAGAPQIAVRWEDPETGLPLKCRIDIMGDGRLVDLKTTTDPTPEAFANQIERLGYHRQAAMYSWGIELLTERPHDWFFVAQRNVAPWDVWTYTLDPRWRSRGLPDIRESITALAKSLKTDVWVPPGYGRRLELSQPKWTEYENPYEIGAL